jgi:hypothetical protein
MTDKFFYHAASLESPASHAFSITPDNDTDLAYLPRAIYVGGYGSLAIVTPSGETVTFVDASGWMPIRAARVLATGTTATDLVGVY